jgi:hypothetical protein
LLGSCLSQPVPIIAFEAALSGRLPLVKVNPLQAPLLHSRFRADCHSADPHFLPELGKLDRRQAGSLVGLVPHSHTGSPLRMASSSPGEMVMVRLSCEFITA